MHKTWNPNQIQLFYCIARGFYCVCALFLVKRQSNRVCMRVSECVLLWLRSTEGHYERPIQFEIDVNEQNRCMPIRPNLLMLFGVVYVCPEAIHFTSFSELHWLNSCFVEKRSHHCKCRNFFYSIVISFIFCSEFEFCVFTVVDVIRSLSRVPFLSALVSFAPIWKSSMWCGVVFGWSCENYLLRSHHLGFHFVEFFGVLEWMRCIGKTAQRRWTKHTHTHTHHVEFVWFLFASCAHAPICRLEKDPNSFWCAHDGLVKVSRLLCLYLIPMRSRIVSLAGSLGPSSRVTCALLLFTLFRCCWFCCCGAYFCVVVLLRASCVLFWFKSDSFVCFSLSCSLYLPLSIRCALLFTQ